jgi:uncharacterized protein (DUF433 family)
LQSERSFFILMGGLRYPVEMIRELLSSGMTIDEILADYEELEREVILAVLSNQGNVERRA